MIIPWQYILALIFMVTVYVIYKNPAWARENVRREDVVFFSGLAFLGTGLWWFKPWVSLTAVGALLIIFSITPFLIQARGGGK